MGIGTMDHGPFLVLLALMLSGCAVHTWAPGPNVNAADFESTKAKCSLMARSGGSSFAAVGSPDFVASAAVGAAIGNGVRTQRDFNDCMLAGGWRIADTNTIAEHEQKIAQYRNILSEITAGLLKTRAKPKYEPLQEHLISLDSGIFAMV
jgi:hypothetical protein